MLYELMLYCCFLVVAERFLFAWTRHVEGDVGAWSLGHWRRYGSSCRGRRQGKQLDDPRFREERAGGHEGEVLDSEGPAKQRATFFFLLLLCLALSPPPCRRHGPAPPPRPSSRVSRLRRPQSVWCLIVFVFAADVLESIADTVLQLVLFQVEAKENESTLVRLDVAPLLSSIKFLVDLAKRKAQRWTEVGEKKSQTMMLK
jgi:hypothetical protein